MKTSKTKLIVGNLAALVLMAACGQASDFSKSEQATINSKSDDKKVVEEEKNELVEMPESKEDKGQKVGETISRPQYTLFKEGSTNSAIRVYRSITKLQFKDGSTKVNDVSTLSISSESCNGAVAILPAHYNRIANAVEGAKTMIASKTILPGKGEKALHHRILVFENDGEGQVDTRELFLATSFPEKGLEYIVDSASVEKAFNEILGKAKELGVCKQPDQPIKKK